MNVKKTKSSKKIVLKITMSMTGTRRVTDSVTGVWYDPSVGGDSGDEGGVGDEASCL